MASIIDGFRLVANLVVTGKFKFSPGAGAGKVMQSDASGNASWQTPAAAVAESFVNSRLANVTLAANDPVVTDGATAYKRAALDTVAVAALGAASPTSAIERLCANTYLMAGLPSSFFVNSNVRVATLNADKTFTLGTEVQIGAAALQGSCISMHRINDSTALIHVTNGATYSFYVATVSGSTVTVGTVATVSGADSDGSRFDVLDEETFVVAFPYDVSGSSFGTKLVVGKISGTTITFGTAATVSSGASGFCPPSGVAALSQNAGVVTWFDNNSSGYARTFTVSGSTVAVWGSQASIAAAAYGGYSVRLSNTKFMVVNQATAGNRAVQIGTVNTTTGAITFGTSYTGMLSGISNHSYQSYGALKRYSDQWIMFTGAVGKIGFLRFDANSSAVQDCGVYIYSTASIDNADCAIQEIENGNIAVLFAISGSCKYGVIDMNGRLGIALAAITAAASGNIATDGVVAGFTGLNRGQQQYMKADGGITTNITPFKLGIAISATQIQLEAQEVKGVGLDSRKVPEIATSVKSKTAAYTIPSNNSENLILADATGAGFTVTLPVSALNAGRSIMVVKTDSGGNTVTVAGAGSELINGANTYTSMTAQYNKVTLFCNGVQWFITAT